MQEDKSLERKFSSDKDIEEFIIRYLQRSLTIKQMNGTANGSNTKFSLTDDAGFIAVFVNGLLVTNYQRIDSKTIMFTVPPVNNSTVVALYMVVR